MAIQTVPSGDERCGKCGDPGDPHYMCEDCYAKYEAEMREEWAELKDPIERYFPDDEDITLH